ncbi:Transcriptional regulatory protein DegU [compost metagenome]
MAQLQRLLPDVTGAEATPTLSRPTITLTSKERHVLELVAQGKSNKEMAKLLGIAPETIKSHMKNIFGKLQVESRAQAAVAAKASGLI